MLEDVNLTSPLYMRWYSNVVSAFSFNNREVWLLEFTLSLKAHAKRAREVKNNQHKHENHIKRTENCISHKSQVGYRGHKDHEQSYEHKVKATS